MASERVAQKYSWWFIQRIQLYSYFARSMCTPLLWEPLKLKDVKERENDETLCYAILNRLSLNNIGHYVVYHVVEHWDRWVRIPLEA
jgi:hypothetical protein